MDNFQFTQRFGDKRYVFRLCEPADGRGFAIDHDAGLVLLHPNAPVTTLREAADRCLKHATALACGASSSPQ